VGPLVMIERPVILLLLLNLPDALNLLLNQGERND